MNPHPNNNIIPISIPISNQSEEFSPSPSPSNAPKHKKKSSIIHNILESSPSNINLTQIDTNELLTKIKHLQGENNLFLSHKSTFEKMKSQNKDYKFRLLTKERELSMLEEKLKLFNIVQSKCESELIEELKLSLEEEYKKSHCTKENYDSLISQLTMKDQMITSLEHKLQSAVQSNTSTMLLNNNLQSQITKRSNVDCNEISDALERVSVLEKDNREKDRVIRELNEVIGNVHGSNNTGTNSTLLTTGGGGEKDVNDYKKTIAVLKGELKAFQKKSIEEKLSLENIIKRKEMNITQLESHVSSQQSSLIGIQEELSTITTQNHSYKKRIEELTTSYKDQHDKLKSQLDSSLSEHKATIKELNQRLTSQEIDLSKSKHLETIYKDQLIEKTKDTEAKLQFITELQSCLNKQIDDNLRLKKQHASVASEMLHYKSKCEELSKEDHNRAMQLEEKVIVLQEVIQRKKRIILNKKKENMIIADMVNCKKSEIQCVEALNIIKSQSIMDNLSKLREKEKENLKKIEEIANDEDYTDDSIEEGDKEDCDYNEGDDDCQGEEDGTIDEEIVEDIKKKINYDDIKDLDKEIYSHDAYKKNYEDNDEDSLGDDID